VEMLDVGASSAAAEGTGGMRSSALIPMSYTTKRAASLQALCLRRFVSGLARCSARLVYGLFTMNGRLRQVAHSG